MRRRLLALLAAPLLGGAVLIAGAAPAQAACPTSGSTFVNYTAPDGRVAAVWVRWVDCGTYKRIQSELFYDSAGVSGIYENSIYGHPSVYVRSGGPNGTIVFRDDGHTYIENGHEHPGNNAACTEPCHVSFDGRMDSTGTDYTFIKFAYL